MIVACFEDGHTERVLEWKIHSRHLVDFKTESGSYVWTNYSFGIDRRFSHSEFYTDDGRYPIAPIVRIKCI